MPGIDLPFVLRSLAGVLVASACAATIQEPEIDPARRPPNVVIVLTDDQGYGDVASQGHPSLRTPHLDALAQSGVRLTQFLLPSSVCTPSRAALLTGCYPKRVGLQERVIFPQDSHGLHNAELTIAEHLGEAGYATAAFGKWHLGHHAGLLPTDQGFDVFEGIPYSNDMSQYQRAADTGYTYRLPWMVGRDVVEWEPDQQHLTQRLTEAAVDFIEASSDRPFLLYLAHPMPHLPLAASTSFRGQSAAGLYGDVLAEVDASVGALRAAIDRLGLSQDTLFVFTSDNGPRADLPGRSAGPFRGGKGTPWEGGHRVPCFVSWPGVLPQGRMCDAPISILDLFPTIAGLTGLPRPNGPPIDGVDVGEALLGTVRSEEPTRSFLYYSKKGELAAIRRGPWKLHLPERRLYHLDRDLHEDRDRAANEPDRVQSLETLALQLDQVLAQEARPVGRSSEQVFDPQRP